MEITCNCPAYSFPHRQSGGKCNLPSTCDYTEATYCLDPEDCECTYCDECPLMDYIHERRYDPREEALTVQERNSNFRSW